MKVATLVLTLSLPLFSLCLKVRVSFACIIFKVDFYDYRISTPLLKVKQGILGEKYQQASKELIDEEATTQDPKSFH